MDNIVKLLPSIGIAILLIFTGAFFHALKTYLRGGVESINQYWGAGTWRSTLSTLLGLIGGAVGSVLSGTVDVTNASGIMAIFLLGYTINSAINTPSEPRLTTADIGAGKVLPALIAFMVLLCLGSASSNSFASTQVVLDCQAPTTRTDNSPFAATEIAGYTFGMTQPAQVRVPLLPAVQAPPCHKVIPIPKGACFKVGTVFDVTVTDNQVVPLTSDAATATLTEELCNLLPKPGKPVNVLITHD